MDYGKLHLVVGGILYNVVILLALLALFTRLRRRKLLFSICLAQYGLLDLQLRLGLGSNDDPGLLAYHIPLGVLIFFVSSLTVAPRVWPASRDTPGMRRKQGSLGRVVKRTQEPGCRTSMRGVNQNRR